MSTTTVSAATLSRPTVVRMWTVQDVSQFLGVPVKTLYDWRTKGYGPEGIKVGRHIRYFREDVFAWVKSQAGK